MPAARASSSTDGGCARVGSGNLRLPYAYRVPLCVPFWSARTYAALARSCCLGRVVAGPDVSRLEARLAARLSVPGAIACDTGRAALEIALRATGVRTGDEVVLPTFCCVSIVPPVLAIGAEPVLADVGPDLALTAETVEAACTPRTRAVVVAHLFGNPTPMADIAAVCRRRGIALIDDAAQALGATLDGQPLGTFGDAGVVSFGNGKVCFGTGGGVLVSRDPAVLARAKSLSLPSKGAGTTLKRAAAVVAWRRWRRWSLPIRVAWTRVRGEPTQEAYAAGAMSNLDAAVALTLLDSLEANLAARRARVETYGRLLGGQGKFDLLRHQPGSACLTQLVDFRGDEALALKVVGVLRDAGYEVDRSFRPLHLQSLYEQFARGRLKTAERLWPSLVELPCEPGVAPEEIERIASLTSATAGN
jgi:dTDP-4-amino-4,6-dideoxygalactose transaminase